MTSDGGLNVSVRVTNTGPDAGSTVPQVYLGAPSTQPAGIQFAVRQLAGFDRVHPAARPVRPGDHATCRCASFSTGRRPSQQWLTAAGSRTVYVGSRRLAASLPLRGAGDDPVVQQHHL